MDWIKMRVDLHRHPKTIRLKRSLLADETYRATFGAMPPAAVGHFIVGCLVIVWGTINSVIGVDDFCPDMNIDDLLSLIHI